MDWIDALHETPDLCGEIEVLDYRAIFIGHYSCVYKGRMKSTRELVAIKVLNSIRGTSVSTMRRKIERERKTWSSLQHPNILPLYGFADDHDLFTPFGAFISPWRSRGDLGEFLIEEGEKTTLRVRLQLWQGVVAGVHHLHSHQPLLVHGDLKPGNVLIDDDGNAQLCDFGLVRVYLNEGHSGMTTASPHCGTERYLAWELVVADEDAIPTAASDIYATGCIGLETLFLIKPYSRYRNNVRWHVRGDMQEGNPPALRPTNLEGELDSLWEILSRCWAHDPLPRPHAHRLLKDVANILNKMDSEEQSCNESLPLLGPSSPQTPFEKATDTPGEILVDDSENSIPTDFSSDPDGGHSKGSDLEVPFGIDLMAYQGRRTGKPRDERDEDYDCIEIDEVCDNASGEGKAQLATFIPAEPVGDTGRVPSSICSTGHSLHGLNTPAPVTVPTGQAGQRQQQQQQQSAHGADHTQRHRRARGTQKRPRSRTVYESGKGPAGQSVTTTVPAPINEIRNSRHGSNTGAVLTSPLMNLNPPSSSSTSGRVGSGRPRPHNISDAPRHTRRASRTQSVLMAAATTQVSMDTNPMWNHQPLFDGRDYPANMVSETSAGHAPYPYGRSQLTYPPAEPPWAPATGSQQGLPANGGRLSQGVGAASMSPYPSRSSIGLAGSLQRSPASTGADSQVYSHNQHSDRYNHIAPGSQYVPQESFGYAQVAQSTHVDAMPTTLQRHQLADTMYTPDPQSQYYHSPHSHSPASPMLPLRSSPQQALYHSDAGPNTTVTPFTTVDDIVKPNQVSYLPPQNHLQSPLPAVSSPSDMSEPPERHSPTPQSRRVPGQRIDADGKMLENSFRGNDDQARVRRHLLDEFQRQPWFRLNQDESKLDAHVHRDILRHGLGMVGRSVYTVFLVEDKDSYQWRCLFGSEEVSCKKADKRFERVERAIEHVRSHLGHRPFACDGTCHKAKSSGINCGRRFFAEGYLEDHKKRPQKRANGDLIRIHGQGPVLAM